MSIEQNNMYDSFRTRLITEMDKEKIDTEVMKTVLKCLDLVADNYKITERQANIIPYTDVNAQMLGYFLACRSVEGMSKQSLLSYGYIIRNFLESIKKPVTDINTLDIRGYLYRYQQWRILSVL